MTLGLLAAFARRGLSVAPFKVGPDFIDPGHHARITGIASRNLDGWMVSKTRNLDCFSGHVRNKDVAVVEGVMGLFDGYDGKSEAGSTAQMAKWLGLPVLLLVDAKSMARSAAALVQGFEGFDTALTFAGVIFNNIGSRRHLEYLKEALQDSVRMPCLGGIRRAADIEIPERHLGLFTSRDHPLTAEHKERLADIIEESVDIETLLDLLPEVDIPAESQQKTVHGKNRNLRIGVPMDNAFCFYYPDNLDLLEACGAELVYFSPIKDNALPGGLDGLYLGGGYPELFAGKLAGRETLRNQIRDKSREGMPIYGECGGFMYLCEELTDTEGNRFPMTGCFPFSARMLSRLKTLGYREVTLAKDTIIGKRSQVIRGHEFHYSELIQHSQGVETVYQVSARKHADPITEGFQINRCLGSYIHLHFGSCPEAGKHFVETCRQYRQERTDTIETRRDRGVEF